MSRTALIVGAGVGGLAAGIALRRAGWQTRIFERAASAREVGFALNLAPNGMKALEELGVADRVIARGHVPAAVEIRRADGVALKRFNVRRALKGVTTVIALRQDLHGALLDATPPESLVFDADAARFTIRNGRVKLSLSDGRMEAGDVLVGADGVGSSIRRSLHPDELPPRASGFCGIRGVARNANEHLGGLSAVAYLGHRIEAATARASADAIYWYVSRPAEDVPADERAVASIHARCLTLLDDPFRAIVRATSPSDLRFDELVDRDPITDWGRGPVTLLGDAAHPLMPHTGQGAAQALEDAVALGLALNSAGSVEGSLRRYEHIRSRRTKPLVFRGRRLAAFLTTRSRTVDSLRAFAFRAIPARVLAATYMLIDARDPHRALRT